MDLRTQAKLKLATKIFQNSFSNTGSIQVILDLANPDASKDYLRDTISVGAIGSLIAAERFIQTCEQQLASTEVGDVLAGAL